jgi:hypothetical protein
MGRRPKGYYNQVGKSKPGDTTLIKSVAIKDNTKNNSSKSDQDAADIFSQLTLSNDKSDDWKPEKLISKDTAYRHSIYSELSGKKKIASRALPFLQRTIEDAFKEKDINDYSKYTSDELADAFVRGCIIDYLYGAGSMYNAWKAVYLIKEVNELKKPKQAKSEEE